MIRTRVRTLAALLVTAALALLAAGCGSDDSTGETTAAETTTEAAAEMTISSPTLIEGKQLAVDNTCDGAGVSPEIVVEGVPAETAELVFVLADPDAPSGTFVHATAFGIDPANTVAPEGQPPPGALVGANDSGRPGAFPPCPPEGDGPHRYLFTAYALSEPSGLEQGAAPADVVAAAEGAEIASVTLTGIYER